MTEYDCVICCDTENGDFHKITSKCTHRAVIICAKCVDKYILIYINEKQSIEIQCPARRCDKIMEREDVKRIATKDVFEKYDNLAFKIAVESIPEFRWCKIPCGSGQIHIGKDEAPIIICESCNGKSCYKHKVIWHEGRTCQEYDDNNDHFDFATEDYILRETKRCPECTAPIEKDGGCDHMTCNCKHQFCWLCLHKYPSHQTTCARHINRNVANLYLRTDS